MSTPARAAERSAFMERANESIAAWLSQSVAPSDPGYTIPEVANWLAPEVLDGHAQSLVPMFTLAMTLFEIFTESVPFSHLKLSSKFESDALKHYICTDGVALLHHDHPIPPAVEDLLSRIGTLIAHCDQMLRVVRSLRNIAGMLLFGELNVLHHGDELNSLAIGAQVEAAGLSVHFDSKPPFRVQYVTRKWQDICGWSFDAISGKTLFETLTGPLTNASRTKSLKQVALGDFHFQAMCTIQNLANLSSFSQCQPFDIVCI